MSKITNELFSCIKAVVGAKELGIDGVDRDDLNALYDFAAAHDLAHLVFRPLKDCGALMADTSSYKAFNKQYYMAIYRYLQQDAALHEIEAAFSEAQISFLPLKGAVLRTYYPEPWMRTMADIDILMELKDEERVHQQLLSMGYENKSYGGKKDNVYFKAPYVTIEMHKNLFMYEDEWNGYFSSPDSPMYVWNRLMPMDGYSCIYQMDSELFYVYMIAHMAKHLKDDGGIGVRAFMDLYVYRQNFEKLLDWDAIHHDLTLLGLTTFAERAATLADCWFSSKLDNINYPDESYECFANYVLDGGTYGSTEYFVANNEALGEERGGSSVGYIWKRAFPSRTSMEKRFPQLKEKGYLLPYYWGKRLWRDGFHRMNAVKNEIKSVQNIDFDKVEAIKKVYREWGL